MLFIESVNEISSTLKKASRCAHCKISPHIDVLPSISVYFAADQINEKYQSAKNVYIEGFDRITGVDMQTKQSYKKPTVDASTNYSSIRSGSCTGLGAK